MGIGESSPGFGKIKDNISIRYFFDVDMRKFIEDLREGYEEGSKLDTTMGRLQKSTNRMERKIKGLNTELKKQKSSFDRVEKSAGRFGRRINVVRIAAGALIAVGLFRVLNLIESSFRKAIDAAMEFETSLFRLANIEQILSKRGIEISMKGLMEGIEEVKKALPIFSEADITEQVSLIGIMTKEMGITEDKIIDIAKAIGVLNVRSRGFEELAETTQKVLTALVAPAGRGIATLGLDFGKANLQAMALENSMLAVGESFANLTKRDKDLLKIAVLLKSTGAELETIQTFLDSNTGRLAQNSSAWEDLLRQVGEFLLPFVPALTEILQKLTDAVITLKQLTVLSTAGVTAYLATVNLAIKTSANNFLLLGKIIKSIFSGNLAEARNFFSQIDISIAKSAKTFVAVYEEAFKQIRDRFFPEMREQIDTPTGPIEDLRDEIKSLEELEGFDDLIDDLEKLSRRIEDVEQDFSIKMSRMLEDFQRARQRINIDFDRKRQDILRSSNKKIRGIQQRARQKALNDEARFQEQLRQLRENFLFDLEDALRERDARQVLRLQRQFQMDKKNLINENALRKKERRTDAAQALQEAIKDRDERLRLLEEERQLKLQRQQEDFDLRRARDEEDQQRRLEDIRRQASERLSEFAQAIAEEFGLNEDATKAIFDLLNTFYGSGGEFDTLFKSSIGRRIKDAQALVELMNGVIANAVAMQQIVANSFNNLQKPARFGHFTIPLPMQSLGEQAKGGTFLATRPTHAIFGESGPEIASFIPVRKLRSSVADATTGSKGMIGGNISVQVLLSPDLEGRIIDASMENVSVVIEKVRRER